MRAESTQPVVSKHPVICNLCTMTFDISPENCDYRGEGNANIVIYLLKEEKVLCLTKYDTSNINFCCGDQYKILNQKISYIKNIMTPLLGLSFVNCPEIITVSKHTIEIMNKLFTSKRPSFRLHKVIPDRESYAFLMPDYCALPISLKQNCTGQATCVEIKPKQGFLSLEEFLPSIIQSRSLVKCRFCMYQNYKLKKKAISSKSSYCPTDLFSGCPQRMRHALKMLLDTPQNNIKIFMDRKVVFSENENNEMDDILEEFFPYQEASSNVDLLCDLVISALLRPIDPFVTDRILYQKVSTEKCPNAYPSCSDDCCHELQPNCVLHRVLSVQMLDNLFVQKIHSFYLQIKEHSREDLGQIGCYSRFEFPSYMGELEKAFQESDFQYASRKVWEYLVALTVKDCSIMLTFQNSPEKFDSKDCIFDSQGNPYQFSVALADLDYKTLDKVVKQYKMVPEILQASFGQRV